MNAIEKDPLLRKLEIFNWILLGLFVAISLIFCSGDFTLGVLLGGLISVVSFFWRQRDLRAAFRNLTGRAQTAVMLRYYIRFIVSAVLIYLIITQTSADVIGLLIGLSIVIINIGVNVVMSVMNKSDRSDKTEEETEQFVTPIKFQKIDPEDNSDEENEDDRK